jgi:hypothetical protein
VLKDEKIAMYKRLYEEIREASRREERLLSSAFYDIGIYLGKMKKNPPGTVQKRAQNQPFLIDERKKRTNTYVKS